MTTDNRAQKLAGRLDTGWMICDQESDPERLAIVEAHWSILVHHDEDARDHVNPSMTQEAACWRSRSR
jgi:hypothetical protein